MQHLYIYQKPTKWNWAKITSIGTWGLGYHFFRVGLPLFQCSLPQTRSWLPSGRDPKSCRAGCSQWTRRCLFPACSQTSHGFPQQWVVSVGTGVVSSFLFFLLIQNLFSCWSSAWQEKLMNSKNFLQEFLRTRWNPWFFNRLLLFHKGEQPTSLSEHLDARTCKIWKSICCGCASPIRVSFSLKRLHQSSKKDFFLHQTKTILHCRVDPEVTLDSALNGWTPETLAFKKNHLEVLVELNKVKELQPCIMESSMGMQILRREERAWRKKIEEKQEELVLKEELRELKEELLTLLNTRGSTSKAEQGTDNKANSFNLHVLVSAAYFVSGFFACYLFLSNFHWAAPYGGIQTFFSKFGIEQGGRMADTPVKQAKTTVKWESVFFLIINWW